MYSSVVLLDLYTGHRSQCTKEGCGYPSFGYVSPLTLIREPEEPFEKAIKLPNYTIRQLFINRLKTNNMAIRTIDEGSLDEIPSHCG